MLFHRFRAVQYDRLRYTREKLKWYQRLRRKKITNEELWQEPLPWVHIHFSAKSQLFIVIADCHAKTHAPARAASTYILSGPIESLNVGVLHRLIQCRLHELLILGEWRKYPRTIIAWSSCDHRHFFPAVCKNDDARDWLNARSYRRTTSAYNIEEFSSSHFRLFKLSRCFGIAREKT